MPKRNLLIADHTTVAPESAARFNLRERAREALRVYRPANDAQERVHTSPALTLVVSGGNRSGKTTVLFSEAISRITGIPIIGRDGQPIRLRFPVPQLGENFEYWFIGHDLDHIGQTIYRVLFQPNLFYVI